MLNDEEIFFQTIIPSGGYHNVVGNPNLVKSY